MRASEKGRLTYCLKDLTYCSEKGIGGLLDDWIVGYVDWWMLDDWSFGFGLVGRKFFRRNAGLLEAGLLDD